MNRCRRTPVAQSVVACTPKLLACFQVVGIQGTPLNRTYHDSTAYRQGRCGSFTLVPVVISPYQFSGPCFKGRQCFSGSGIHDSLVGSQSFNQSGQAVYRQLGFPAECSALAIYGIQVTQNILGKYDIISNGYCIFDGACYRIFPYYFSACSVHGINKSFSF